MSERVIIELSEDIVNAMTDKEVEIIKLQKMMIKDLTHECNSYKNQLTTLIDSSSKHEIEVIELETQLDDLTARIADLIDKNNKLEDIHEDSVRSEEFHSLQSKYDQAAVTLEVNKATLKATLKTSHELERKLTDAQFKLGTLKHEHQDLTDSHKSISADNHFLTTQFKKEHEELVTANKLIAELKNDVSGFPIRMDNACKAAVKQYIDTHKEQSKVYIDKSDDQLKQSKKEIEQLNAELRTKNDEITSLNNCLALKDKDILDLEDMINIIEQKNEKSVGVYQQLEEQNKAQLKYCRDASELIASIHADNVKLQRDVVYLQQMFDFFGGKKVYTSESGITVFMLHNDFRECVSVPDWYEDKDTPNPLYPVFWVVHPNGMGHMVMIDKLKEHLLLPADLPKKYLVKNSEHTAIFEAIKKISLAEYVNALHVVTEISKKVAINAEYLDYNFAKTFDRSEFVRKCIIHGCLEKDKIKAMEEGFLLLNTLSTNYRNKQKAIKQRKLRQESSQSKKKKKKK